MQQAEPLFNNRVFIEYFAAQNRDIDAQTPGLVHHVLRGTLLRRQIRQPSCGNHAVRDRLLLTHKGFQRRPLFRQGVEGELAQAWPDGFHLMQA